MIEAALREKALRELRRLHFRRMPNLLRRQQSKASRDNRDP
jgi:hypothetical protein